MPKSVYIHIPFCESICSYCDFCKLFYNEVLVKKYLDALEKEIKENYKFEEIETIYIGGGTPSVLSISELKKLFRIIKIFKKSNNLEFTFEGNPESLTKEKLEFLYKSGVNRLSIGVQTFNKKHLKYLERNHNKKDVENVVLNAKRVGFNNISIDLIFGFYNQTIKELEKDLKEFLNLNIDHISCYSLMIEPATKLYINNTKTISEDLEVKMYYKIIDILEKHGFEHYEISNFARNNRYSRHNLTYWNNEEYYGFGLGAHGYVSCRRYENTKSFTKYLKSEYRLNSCQLTLKEKLENELILGFRKIKGIEKEKFYQKYGKNIEKIPKIKELLSKGKLIDTGSEMSINKNFIYISNEILQEFID